MCPIDTGEAIPIPAAAARPAPTAPSFAIAGAPAGQPPDPTPRRLGFDRIDSRLVLQLARCVYVAFLNDGAATREPIGIVISLRRQLGRAVFESPLLLPGEQFVPLDWIRNQPRSQPRRPPAPQRFTPR